MSASSPATARATRISERLTMAPIEKAVLLSRLAGGLIVSVQPVTGSPLDTVELVRAMALAVSGAGCVGLRIESQANVRAVAAATDLPVIGLIKSWPPGEPVFITATPRSRSTRSPVPVPRSSPSTRPSGSARCRCRR